MGNEDGEISMVPDTPKDSMRDKEGVSGSLYRPGPLQFFLFYFFFFPFPE